MRLVSKPSLGRAAAGGGSPARAARSASFLLFCFSSPRFGLGREIIHPLLSCLRHSLPLTCLFPLYKIKHLHRLRYINLFPSSHKAAILAQGQLCYLIRPLTCTIPASGSFSGSLSNLVITAPAAISPNPDSGSRHPEPSQHPARAIIAMSDHAANGTTAVDGIKESEVRRPR